MNEKNKGSASLKTAHNEGVDLKRFIMPLCGTCDYWMRDEIPEGSMPYCAELQYWTGITEREIVPADFGCVRHSSIKEEAE